MAQDQAPATRVLFICLGNICRSPAAEAVMQHQVAAAGLSARVTVDSAGTGDWHVGELADPRMRAAGARRGYALTHRARQVKPEDFQHFDYLVVMDDSNYANVERLAPVPADLVRLHRFVSFCQRPHPGEVPDPYYGPEAGFEQALDLLEDGCAGLLAVLTKSPSV